MQANVSDRNVADDVHGLADRPDGQTLLLSDDLAGRALGGAVTSVRRLTGGASQESWYIQVDAADAFVLRRTPPGDVMDRGGGIAMQTEAAVIRAVGDHGVPVPEVVHVLEPSDELGCGFIMRHVGGEALGHRIVRADSFADVRPRLAAQCGDILARLHAVPLDILPPLPRRGPAEAVAELHAQLRASGEARPVFEAALAWLHTHCPDRTPLGVVHGDFRNGNLLVDKNGVAAVLDWEGCHIGDPAADLGWLCMPIWRFGRLDLPVGGFGRRADLLAAYAARRSLVDAARLRFWEIHGMLRWGLTCMAMTAAFLAGDRSIERAAVGRRTSEAELELLFALTGGAD